MKVAVPSYRRAETCKKATVAELLRGGFAPDQITVYVANDAERIAYEAEGLGVPIVVGVLGLLEQRKFISARHPRTEDLLMLDDDCYSFQHAPDDKRLVPYPDGQFSKLAAWAFETMRKQGAGMWGIVPTMNAFYMDQNAYLGQTYICGITQGTRGSDPIYLSKMRFQKTSGEDFEATAQAIESYGAVLRIGWLSVKTKYFAPGGICANFDDKREERVKDHEDALRHIAARHPELCRLYNKADGLLNIRIKPKRLALIERPAGL